MVVLVDDTGEAIGTHLKSSVHGESTPRHLAFSCHVLDRSGRLLVTRRALSKRTWPGVWTNSFCGHPAPGEDIEQAVQRRAAFELGLTVTDITCVLPEFGYVARDASGIVENEHCPVFIATVDADPAPNPDEVAEYVWTTPAELGRALEATPWAFSPWLVEHFGGLTAHLDADARAEGAR